ncbi:MAG: quinolinate synthetase [candidate division Zixibacteria bacterium SM23_81]|nr:MAG: quinolinate synthetase [candidate division Zixibacteria bacterium SM23_81]
MSSHEIVRQIAHWKEKRGAVILAHNYQPGEIQDIADFLGDSLALSRQAAEEPAQVIVFCGVRFMAESAKILSPDKTVLLPRRDVGCPLADTITADQVRQLKEAHPQAAVVCYVNSSAEVKAESDVCCTSSNALQVVDGVEAQEIIFVPDKNLGHYVSRFTKKKVIIWDGFCYVHHRIRAEELQRAKKAHPQAVVLVHPECRPEVIDLADHVLSTDGMLRFAQGSEVGEFIIGTEVGLIYRLQKENPGQRFFAAGNAMVCVNMKKIHLEDVLLSLQRDQFSITISEEIRTRAQAALSRMLQYVTPQV